jgi:hypothetical protein
MDERVVCQIDDDWPCVDFAPRLAILGEWLAPRWPEWKEKPEKSAFKKKSLTRGSECVPISVNERRWAEPPCGAKAGEDQIWSRLMAR